LSVYVAVYVDGRLGSMHWTLDDGDAGFISFSAVTYSALENSGDSTLLITRNGGTTPEVVVEPYLVQWQGALEDRFTLVGTSLTFAEGVMTMDSMYRSKMMPTFSFGPIPCVLDCVFSLVGLVAIANITAVDDGDLSLPNQCTGLQLMAVTGGSMELRWIPPLDRG
jgi:hypothetical protein